MFIYSIFFALIVFTSTYSLVIRWGSFDVLTVVLKFKSYLI